MLLLFLLAGCHDPETIQMDLTTDPVRFIIDHRGWPRPFWWPRVTEFAIAEKEEGEMWQLKAANSEGELARELAIVYGEVPPGWLQVFPEKDARAKPLVPGKNYFAAAAGPKSIYRMVFGLPIDARLHHPPAASQPAGPDPDSQSPEP